MAFCGKCGAYIAEGSNVCPACGKRTGSSDTQSSAPGKSTGAAQKESSGEYRHAYRQSSGRAAGQRTRSSEQSGAGYTYNNNYNVYSSRSRANNSGFISGQYPMVALLSYFSILFLVPYFLRNDNDFVRFHANQGLLLFLFAGVCGVLGNLPVFGWLLEAVGWLITVVFFFMGIGNVLGRRYRELPIIGRIRLIK